MNHSAAEGRHIGVVGGGMLGLTIAWRLNALGHHVTLFEAASAVGGLTARFSTPDFSWDRFYHVIDSSDRALIALLDELGIAHHIQWRTTKTLFFDGRRHFPLNNAIDYLRLPTLRIDAKARVALNIIYAGARQRRGKLESISAERWLRRWSGQHAYTRLWAPLLRTKLGANVDKASAAFIWSVIRRFYGARQGSRRTEQFGFMPGGYARIIDAFCERIVQRGVRIITSARVHAATSGGARRLQLQYDDSNLDFDDIIFTCAAPIVVKSCTSLTVAERTLHESLQYQGVVCLSLLLQRPLGGAYMTYITDDTIPFTTVIEMSSLTGTSAYDGNHLVYLPRYLPCDDPLFDCSDDEVTSLFINGLRRLYPDFDDTQITTSRVARARYVMALPTLNYSASLPPIETSIAGLYVCNSAQIVDASLNVNEAVQLGNSAVERLYRDAG